MSAHASRMPAVTGEARSGRTCRFGDLQEVIEALTHPILCGGLCRLGLTHGDLNDDGETDMVIGAPGYDGGAGAVYGRRSVGCV